MKITPIDIAHKNFNKKMFGLDEAEVVDFLQQIANQMEALIHERNTLKEMVREREVQLNDSKERDHVLKSTISTAGQMADRIRTDAEREAKLIIADAHQKSDMITRDSRDSLKKAYQEISDLKRVRMQFEANLKALAQAHLSLIEQGEKFMPTVGLPNTNLENTAKAMNEAPHKSAAISPLSVDQIR
ncbi:MAG: DivIVA domain-containing protein [Pseudobdellovibrionaceae bacterium]